MDTTGQADPHPTSPRGEPRMTLSRLRHDMRNYLNAIKLSCALLQRKHKDELSIESIQEIDRSTDGINDLIARFMGDAEAADLLKKD